MNVKIKGIVGHVLKMEAVVSGGCGTFDIVGYCVKVLTADGSRVEFEMLPTNEIEVVG